MPHREKIQRVRAIGFPGTFNDAPPLERRDMISHLIEDATIYFQRGDLSGILFYGDNHIFHYLEAKASYMDELKRDVLNYPLFHGQKFLYDEAIPQWNFKTWQVKYVRNEQPLKEFFKRHGWDQFNPFLLEGALLDEFMQIVMLYADAGEIFETDSAANQIHHVPEKEATLWHYMLGTVVLIALAWLAFMLLSHFGYINFTPLYQQ